jgi:hypothetical protein
MRNQRADTYRLHHKVRITGVVDVPPNIPYNYKGDIYLNITNRFNADLSCLGSRFTFPFKKLRAHVSLKFLKFNISEPVDGHVDIFQTI